MKLPSTEEQEQVLSINEDKKDKITIPRTNDKLNIGWICDVALEKVSLLELESGLQATGEDTPRNVRKRAKLLSKATSYLVLNGVKIFFFHWLLWRYFYYIKSYSADQLYPIIELAKKKAPLLKSYQASMLVSHLKITNPTLTKEEVELFQAELLSESNQPSGKSMDGR